MLGTLRHSRLLAMAAALVLGTGSAPVLASQPAMVSAAPRPMKASKRDVFGGARASTRLFGRKGAGTTAAQQKRASRKKRGVARNRVNHR